MKTDRRTMQPITMIYTNYRGETSVRNVTPIVIDWGTNAYHPEPQWLMSAYDNDKGPHREFALRDCDFTVTEKAGLPGREDHK